MFVLCVINHVNCIIQISNVLSKLPMVTVRWRVKHKSCDCTHYMCGMPSTIGERKWINISAASEEECIVQVELSRESLAGKVLYINVDRIALTV